MRTALLETARPLLEAMVQDVTGVKVVSLHHDLSSATGEEVILFTLAEAPKVRAAKPQEPSDHAAHLEAWRTGGR